MSKHTPGPWEVDATEPLVLVTAPSDVDGADLDIICEMHTDLNVYPEEVEANAQLIKAAPDLLEALNEVMETVMQQQFTEAVMLTPQWERATAAIAKAEPA